MDLKEIMAISGKPGLYKFISQGRNAMIVENMETKHRTSAFATDKVSSLEDIAIFTSAEEVPLNEVLKKIFDREEGKETISHKSPVEDLKNWFEDILPTYDHERVYVSDIKKIIQWYNLLLKLNMLIFKDDEEKKEEPEKDQKAPETKEKETKVKE